MRVIAGSARRLNLVTPKGMTTRPTSDKIKETLFNILAPELIQASFLDLFAGSGGIGIEALSRGAAGCTFIEKDREALACIRKNLETTRLSDKAEVIGRDVFTALYDLHPKKGYDIVFIDPPYASGYEKNVLNILSGQGILNEDAIVIVEASAETDFSFTDALGFDVTRIKEYKNNKHVFLRQRQ
ncbi:MAG: 16S rRNA (guanine(966)-N(2))-methyltransferase RsmD [Lachnospiraceae bacterium]|nr:16S rRNA (guanine(966)-N(2))-methyltransferase RsmD [Lachnospiraceae bacterium]